MTNRTAIATARSELASIETELAALQAGKSAAARSSADYLKWRTSYDGANSERERLTALVETLEAEAEIAAAKDAAAELRRRYENRKAANAKLAARIKSDLAKANSILLGLIREVAAAQIATEAIQRLLHEPPIGRLYTHFQFYFRCKGVKTS